MHSLFESLPEEKQRKILSAAMEEFAKHGYTSASTNRIVEKAEISKGILFHYFKNKKGLYVYLMHRTIHFLTQKYEAAAPTLGRDVFDRIGGYTAIKLELIEQFPLEHDLMTKAMQETAEDIKAEMAKIIAETTGKAMIMLFQDMDVSKFRPGVDIQKAIEVITWTMESFGTKYVAEHTDAEGRIQIDRDQLLQGMNEYIELLKTGLYDRTP